MLSISYNTITVSFQTATESGGKGGKGAKKKGSSFQTVSALHRVSYHGPGKYI